MKYLAALIGVLTFASFAQANEWQVIKESSEIGFTAEQDGQSFSGAFPAYDAAITFSPEALDAASIAITLDMSKVTVEGDDRQEEITGEEWFDVSRFATASFVSKGLELRGENTYLATGMLEIRGVSKPIAVPFTLTPQGNDYLAEGAFTINRRDFLVGSGEWEEDTWIAFPVNVHFSLKTSPKS